MSEETTTTTTAASTTTAAEGTKSTTATTTAADTGAKAEGAKDATTTEKKSFVKGGETEKQDGADDSAAKGDQAKAKDGASDTPYEVKVPEGVKVDPAKLESFTGWAKEKGLSAAQATEALAFYVKQQDSERQAWAKQGDDWYGQLEKDSEFGGAHVKESAAAVQRGLKRFDPKGELVGDLEKYGIENLPSLNRFLRRVGLAIAEDKATVVTAKPGAKTVSSEVEKLAKEFPSLAKELTGAA